MECKREGPALAHVAPAVRRHAALVFVVAAAPEREQAPKFRWAVLNLEQGTAYC